MSLKDKLEIGLKPDAPYRPDNLPEFQKDDPACRIAGMPGDSDEARRAREECAEIPVAPPRRAMVSSTKARGKAPVRNRPRGGRRTAKPVPRRSGRPRR
jgi:hypothetical protein